MRQTSSQRFVPPYIPIANDIHVQKEDIDTWADSASMFRAADEVFIGSPGSYAWQKLYSLISQPARPVMRAGMSSIYGHPPLNRSDDVGVFSTLAAYLYFCVHGRTVDPGSPCAS